MRSGRREGRGGEELSNLFICHKKLTEESVSDKEEDIWVVQVKAVSTEWSEIVNVLQSCVDE